MSLYNNSDALSLNDCHLHSFPLCATVGNTSVTLAGISISSCVVDVCWL